MGKKKGQRKKDGTDATVGVPSSIKSIDESEPQELNEVDHNEGDLWTQANVPPSLDPPSALYVMQEGPEIDAQDKATAVNDVDLGANARAEGEEVDAQKHTVEKQGGVSDPAIVQAESEKQATVSFDGASDHSLAEPYMPVAASVFPPSLPHTLTAGLLANVLPTIDTLSHHLQELGYSFLVGVCF